MAFRQRRGHPGSSEPLVVSHFQPFSFLKHAKSGKPHTKNFFYDYKRQAFFWIDPSSKTNTNLKQSAIFPLKDIKSLNLGISGPNFQRAGKIPRRECLSIIGGTLLSAKRLDIQARDQVHRQRIIYSISSLYYQVMSRDLPGGSRTPGTFIVPSIATPKEAYITALKHGKMGKPHARTLSNCADSQSIQWDHVGVPRADAPAHLKKSHRKNLSRSFTFIMTNTLFDEKYGHSLSLSLSFSLLV